MTFDRPVIFLDTETTGVDPVSDRIIEAGIAHMEPDGAHWIWAQRFYPGVPIPEEATAVHGIRDDDVAGCPRFSDWALRIEAVVKGKDIAGYNIRFDLQILDEELRRCGMKLDLSSVNVIDCYGIFAKKEPRKLEDAVRRYCGRGHGEAHGALSDAVASMDVLKGQLAAYPDLAGMTVGELARYSQPGDRPIADLAGKLSYDDSGELCFAFGKYAGQPVGEHLDYAEWMLTKDFPGSTLDFLRELLAGARK